MKKFALFMGVDYYPGGGWEDFKMATETLDEVHEYLESLSEERKKIATAIGIGGTS